MIVTHMANGPGNRSIRAGRQALRPAGFPNYPSGGINAVPLQPALHALHEANPALAGFPP